MVFKYCTCTSCDYCGFVQIAQDDDGSLQSDSGCASVPDATIAHVLYGSILVPVEVAVYTTSIYYMLHIDKKRFD